MILLFVVVFSLSITIVLGDYILDTFYEAVEEGGITTVQSNETRVVMQESFLVFDYSLMILAIIMIIGLMISSFLIPTHPIFLVINIIGIFILVFLGMVMTNVYGEIVSGEGAEYLGDSADKFSLINFMMNNIAFVGAIAIFLTSVIMFSRST